MSQRTTSRRRLLKSALAGGLGFALAHQLGLRTTRADDEPIFGPDPVAKAKSLIVLWMNGGPSHIDTFDPKRGHRDAGSFSAIRTRAAGMELCEHLPQLADQADKLAIIRSMTSKEGNHERARSLGHTGYTPNPTAGYPGFGSWISAERSSGASLPSFVSLAGPSVGPGFLGVEHAPFVVRQPGAPPDNTGYGFAVDSGRFDRRMKALAQLENDFTGRVADKSVQTRRAVFERAVAMMRSPELSAFDLSQEPAAAVEAYGDSDFGRGCMLARRLVEAGVGVVEVTLGGWDTHQNNFDRTRKLCGVLDPAMSSLLRELHERSMLDSTLVLCMGEFGRSPNINGRDGRDHYPRAWSAVLAGGGVRGGVVHGATDERGAVVTRDPVRIADLYATVATQMGVAPDKVVMAAGRPIAVTDKGKAIASLVKAA
jgi:uncharacterized protein (DUF1501 family)